MKHKWGRTTEGTHKGREITRQEALDMGRRGTIRQRAEKLEAKYGEAGITWPISDFLTLEEAAQLLNWSRQAVYHAVKNTKEIPAQLAGGRYLIAVEDLARFVMKIVQLEIAEIEREAAVRGIDLDAVPVK